MTSHQTPEDVFDDSDPGPDGPETDEFDTFDPHDVLEPDNAGPGEVGPQLPVAGFPSAAARVNALTRDRARLHDALNAHSARRYDAGLAEELRTRAVDLLITLQSVAHDDALWDQLAQGLHPLTQGQEDLFDRLGVTDFEAVLTWGGYGSPPPPPVEEVADDIVGALSRMVDLSGNSPEEYATAREQLGEARRGLHLSLYRIRRQIDVQPSARAASGLRRGARALLNTAAAALPAAAGVAAGAAAGAVVGGAFPNEGVGYVVGASVESVAELVVMGATVLVVQRFAGRQAVSETQVQSEAAQQETGLGWAVQFRDHLRWLEWFAGQDVAPLDDPAFAHSPEQSRLMAEALRRMKRLTEICLDHGFGDLVTMQDAVRAGGRALAEGNLRQLRGAAGSLAASIE